MSRLPSIPLSANNAVGAVAMILRPVGCGVAFAARTEIYRGLAMVLLIWDGICVLCSAFGLSQGLCCGAPIPVC